MINLRRSAVVLMAATAAGYALSFGKEAVVAWLFGTGPEMDAYYAALALPNFLTTLLGFAVYAILVPTYVTWKIRRPDAADALSKLVLRDVTLALGLLSALLALLAGPLMRLLFPGIPSAVAARAAQLERLMAWAAVASGTANLVIGLLNAQGSFAVPSLSASIVTLTTLAAIALFRRHGAMALAGGLVAGAALQALWLLRRWRRVRGHDSAARIGWGDPDLKDLLPFATAVMATFGMSEINNVVDRLMASFSTPGSVASIGYALKLLLVPQQILCIPVAAVAFPVLAEKLARADEAALRQDFGKACRLSFALILPATALLLRYSGAIVVLFFQRGRFDPRSTWMVARVLSCFALSLPFTTPLFLVSRLAIIRRQTRIILAIGAAGVGLNAAFDWLLMRWWDPPVAGIALSTSLTTAAALAAYLAFLRRAHPWLGMRTLGKSARPYLLPTATMALTAEAAWRLLPRAAPLPRLAAALLAGSAALAVAAHFLRLDEMVRGMSLAKAWFGAEKSSAPLS